VKDPAGWKLETIGTSSPGGFSFVVSTAEGGGRQRAWPGGAEAEADQREGERTRLLSVPPNAMTGHGAMLGENRHRRTNCSLVVESRSGTTRGVARELNATVHEVRDEESSTGLTTPRQGAATEHPRGPVRQRVLEPIWIPRPRGNSADRREYRRIRQPGPTPAYTSRRGRFATWCNNLLQILGIVARRRPAGIDADALHWSARKVFDALRTIDPDRVVTGIRGLPRKRRDVADDSRGRGRSSRLEALVDTWRWSGVPF